MEAFIKSLIDFLGPKFSAWLGVGVLALVIIPAFFKAWESWLDARSGVRAQRAERNRLELVKLWLEVEVIRKSHNLELPFPIQPPLTPTLAPSTQTVNDVLDGQSRKPIAAAPKARLWNWLSWLQQKHDALSTLAIVVLTVITLVLTAMSLVLCITSFMTLSANAADIAFAVISTALSLAFVLFIRALNRQRLLLVAA